MIISKLLLWNVSLCREHLIFLNIKLKSENNIIRHLIQYPRNVAYKKHQFDLNGFGETIEQRNAGVKCVWIMRIMRICHSGWDETTKPLFHFSIKYAKSNVVPRLMKITPLTYRFFKSGQSGLHASTHFIFNLEKKNFFWGINKYFFHHKIGLFLQINAIKKDLTNVFPQEK